MTRLVRRRSAVRRLFEGAAMVGWGNIPPLVRYTAAKRRMDEAYAAGRAFPAGQPFPWAWPRPRDGSDGWAGPGRAVEVERTERGIRARFEGQGEPGAAAGARAGAGVTLSLALAAPDLLEVRWGSGAEVSPSPARDLVARPVDRWPPITVDVAAGSEGWTLRTGMMTVLVAVDGRVTVLDAAGGTVREEQPPLFCGEAVCHRVRLAPGEHICGLGERTGGVDLRGRVLRLWNRDPGGDYGPGDDPVYLSIPVYLSRSGDPGRPGYLAFYANSYPGVVEVGRAEPSLLEHLFAAGGLTYYIALGPVQRALARLADLLGHPPLPPLWALGYHQCRWSYYPESRVRKLAADFARYEIPVDAVHLDIHYMDGYRVFTVDRRRFPDLAALAGDLRRQGIRLVAIVDPGIKRDRGYHVFREGEEKGVFVTLPDGRTAVAPVWPGPAAFPDFTRPEVREWWADKLGLLLSAGVTGFWLDMNEPSVFVSGGDPTLPLGARHAAGDHLAVHNLYGLYMNAATYDGLRRLDPERRPFIVSRSGWAGLERYAWTWTADVRSDWACLRQTIATVIGLGLSGAPFSGSDVGGFHGRPTPELYIRWLQMSAFMPFFRSHTKIGTPDQEPWSFGEPYTSIAREFIRLRYALLPYLYTLAWEASRTGAPLVRPLFWAGGPDSDDAFLLGDALLVAPVVEEGATRREVPLPPGLWYDYWTGRPLKGPGRFDADAPLSRIPLLVRAGTVLPTEDPASSTSARTMAVLRLELYPPEPGAEVSSLLYTDAGDGYGPARLDRFCAVGREGSIRFRWDELPEPEGRGAPAAWPYRSTRLALMGTGGRPGGRSGRGVGADSAADDWGVRVEPSADIELVTRRAP